MDVLSHLDGPDHDHPTHPQLVMGLPRGGLGMHQGDYKNSLNHINLNKEVLAFFVAFF